MRLPREDGPGTFHHVMNRGLARRPVFETEADIRFFLSRIAWEVKHGRILLLAYAILTTHFHLLVESTVGELSRSMRRIENAFVRWFNRRRKRDGPLFRGRFTSRPVQSIPDLITVVRYIDNNPVEARLSQKPEHYPHCSAKYYSISETPRWLSHDRIGAIIGSGRSADGPIPIDYGRVFSTDSATSASELVERRWKLPPGREDPLKDLVGSAPDRVRNWMIRKAILADGTKSGLCVVSPRSVLSASDYAGEEDRSARSQQEARRRRILVSGILRLCGGLTIAEIAERLSCSRTTAHLDYRAFCKLVEQDATFAEAAGEVLHAALGLDHPWATGGIDIQLGLRGG